MQWKISYLEPNTHEENAPAPFNGNLFIFIILFAHPRSETPFRISPLGF